MLLASLWSARAAGQRMLTLEVRASNEAAIALYRSCGLALVGRRPKYYKRPPEDALLLSRDFVDDADERGGLDPTEPPDDLKRPSAEVSEDADAARAALPRLEALVHGCGTNARVIRQAASAGDAEGALLTPEALGVLIGELSW